MSKLSNVWVFSDIAARLPETIAGARALGEKVSAFIIGSEADIATAYSYGASHVYYLGNKADTQMVEDYATTMSQAIYDGDKPTLMLLPATKRCKALAAKLSVQLEAGLINDATEVTLDEGVTAKHMVYGGLAIGTEKIASPVALVTLASGAFEAQAADTSLTGEGVSLPFVAPKQTITCIERRVKQGNSVDLGKAKRVIAVGSGIGNLDNLGLAGELATSIQAELGCSRPIAETEKWMERERYVGVSGVMLKPDVYLALGISGQIQHMVGALGSQTILAVNKDKNAPIFQYVDYGLVGDINKVLPALIEAMKG
ncbi:FAD-binding protein [Shewanella insulae]|uniref:FAD-binding protein n=1 Tax=Shewanella insulae TaxID=2681496 RepID=UPI001EFE7398|nr:FAD-binding protein [Shewanella insulae]MCG9714988.1 FAD-binding protein [Shewanella insulae]MCG9754016.1 FAD-binding protein [Shewanella insulae]